MKNRTAHDLCRVVVVDGQVLIREGLSRVLEESPGLACAGVAASGREALALLDHADVMVTELEFENESGFELIHKLRSRSAVVGIVVHSGLTAGAFVSHCMALGADAFVQKGTPLATLLVAIRRAAQGDHYFGPGLGEGVTDYLEARRRGVAEAIEPVDALSLGELQVLQKMSLGMTTAETAHSLSKGVKTVATFQLRIRRKLGLANLEQLIRFAVLHFARAARR